MRYVSMFWHKNIINAIKVYTKNARKTVPFRINKASNSNKNKRYNEIPGIDIVFFINLKKNIPLCELYIWCLQEICIEYWNGQGHSGKKKLRN